ncbi:MAG TPA: hypothetical protein VFZ58_01400 [Candidatus Saccharimonadales bacterium]
MFKKWEVDNIGDILSHSVRCLYLKTETVEAQMQLWHEHGYNFKDPAVQALLPQLLHAVGAKGLQTAIRPIGEIYKTRQPRGSNTVKPGRKAKPKPKPRADELSLYRESLKSIKEVHEFTEDHLQTAQFIAGSVRADASPEVLIEELGLYKLSDAQTNQLIELMSEYPGDELRLRDVVKLIESL